MDESEGCERLQGRDEGVAQPSEQDRFQVRTDTSGESATRAPNISLGLFRGARVVDRSEQ